MELELQQSRDIWENAFFTGNYEVLAHYEHRSFKVIYEQEGRVEANYTRYDRIAHAVQNGVWKPRNPDIMFEEFNFNRDGTLCHILVGLKEGARLIRESWLYEQGWKISELRFLKPSDSDLLK